MQRFKSLTIEIEGGDDALASAGANAELGRILRDAARKIEHDSEDFESIPTAILHDRNGNRVGTMTVETEDVPPAGWLCEECLPVITDGDATHLDYSAVSEESAAAADALLKTIEAGAARLGEINVDPDVETESHETCACCGRRAWGTYTGYYDKE